MKTDYIPPAAVLPAAVLPAAVLALTIAFAVAPAFTPPFMGYAAGQLPVPIDRHAVQPAGYAFAIWGLIYAWLIVHAAFGLLRRRNAPEWGAARTPLMAALALGTVWLALASSWPLVAGAVILGMAAFCLTAFLRAPVSPDRWILSAPLAIFAGWLTAASLVSTGVILGGYGVMTHQNAAYLMVAILLIAAIFVQSKRPQMPVYGLTVVWAIVAVWAVNRAGEPMIATTALAAAAIMFTATAVLRIKN